MNISFLTDAKSAIIHAIFYLQTQNIKVNNVIVKGEKSKYYLLLEYSQVNNFNVFFVPELNSKETIYIFNKLKPDIVFLMCSRIINKEIIKIPKYIINVHAGILPKYRGFDVRRWAILEDESIGVSAHFIDEDADTGDIILLRKLKIEPGDTIESISRRNYYNNRYIALAEALKQIINNTLKPIKQKPNEGKKYFWMHQKLREIVDKKLELLKNNM